MCKIRLDLVADVESIEGNNKSQTDNAEYFWTTSQDCCQGCSERQDSNQPVWVKRADTVYNFIISDRRWEHCTRWSYFQQCLHLWLFVINVQRLKMQRGGGGVCVLVFYGVARFAIFSSCVLCCFAAWCGAHHRDAVKKKDDQNAHNGLFSNISALQTFTCLVVLTAYTKPAWVFVIFMNKEMCFAGFKRCFGAVCLCFLRDAFFYQVKRIVFIRCWPGGELERCQRADSALSKKSNVPSACLLLLCYYYYYYYYYFCTLPFNQHRCVGKEDQSRKGKSNRTKKEVIEAEKRETREKQKRKVDWSRGG